MRKLLRKPKPKHWRRQKNFAARLQQWSKVDWRETNGVIGQKIGVSLQWVHRVRRALGMPNATIQEPPDVWSGPKLALIKYEDVQLLKPLQSSVYNWERPAGRADSWTSKPFFTSVAVRLIGSLGI